MEHVQRAAAAQMRKALFRIPAGERKFQDAMDDGSIVAVRIEVIHEGGEGRAIVDFAGTSPTAKSNLNANPAIVRAAVLYSLRCLIEGDIPINDGVLDPVEIRIPPGSMLHPIADADPSKRPAVGGGNVETSQRIVDVVLAALGAAAASQGTMNNFLFGRPATPTQPGFGYYETICGGAGGGPDFDGASAVHTHMTNTRITDPEVLEDRYPVRLRRFAIRRGSGGGGLHPGGDGVVREFEFRSPVEAALVTNRRTTAPFGLAGGADGSPGRNTWIRTDGELRDLGSTAQFSVEAGDVVRIETPGGGGYGPPTTALREETRPSGYVESVPLVEGTAPSERGSSATAARSERAADL
jgi:5-oxoprolinase (ATP-hydrolysing)